MLKISSELYTTGASQEQSRALYFLEPLTDLNMSFAAFCKWSFKGL